MIGNRLAYTFGDPQRGDIAIFKFPDDESQLFIKRVIGLPGDKIQIIDGLVYVNDSAEPLQEDYLAETPAGDFGPYYVPEDSYFMMGDNRNYSKDSRLWENTYVKRDKILAKAALRYYPFDKFGTIE
ncbi:MAG: signal peptidase I [Ruminococcus sp.]